MSDDVKMYEANCSLKRVMGNDATLGEMDGADVQACQVILDHASRLFFDRAAEDVVALEALVAQMESLENAVLFEKVGKCAHNLRGQAEILGFTLITTITRQLAESIENAQIPSIKKRQLTARITQLLRVAFDGKIRDAGGPMGEQVLALLDGYIEDHRAA